MRPRVSLGYVLNPFEITELHGRENGKEMNRMREGEIENKGPLGLLIPVAKLGCKQNVTENKNRVCVCCECMCECHIITRVYISTSVGINNDQYY